MTMTFEQARDRLQELLRDYVDLSLEMGFADYPITVDIIQYDGGIWVFYHTMDVGIEQVFPSDVKIELREINHNTWDGRKYNTWELVIGEPSANDEYRPSLTAWTEEGKDIFKWCPREVIA